MIWVFFNMKIHKTFSRQMETVLFLKGKLYLPTGSSVCRIFFFINSRGPGLSKSWLLKLSANFALFNCRCFSHNEGSTPGLTSSRICLCGENENKIHILFCKQKNPFTLKYKILYFLREITKI